jgi:hypothetical protein
MTPTKVNDEECGGRTFSAGSLWMRDCVRRCSSDDMLVDVIAQMISLARNENGFIA